MHIKVFEGLNIVFESDLKEYQDLESIAGFFMEHIDKETEYRIAVFMNGHLFNTCTVAHFREIVANSYLQAMVYNLLN